jgi:epoxyqueuosine reductase
VPAGYVETLRDIAAAHGITHTGVASAQVMQRARDELFRRRQAGLHDGMQFTYRNPVRSTDPCAAVPGARSVIVGALPYLLDEQDPIAHDDSQGSLFGRVARYAWIDHHAALRVGLQAVVNRLRSDGWKAVAFADDNSMVDREIAHRAGIGWFGKNSNLLLAGGGSYFVLGSVVTVAPLPVANEVVADGCGTCRRCLDGCPTGAIIEPGVIDAGRCLAWLLQKPGMFDVRFREALGDRIYGCDDCQEVCPPTVRLGESSRRPSSEPRRPVVDVIRLLTGSDAEVLSMCGRWYIADRDPRWVRRNALIVLGNIAGPADHHVSALLGRYLSHHDPMLRAHAVWAARRLCLDHMLVVDDPDPLVQAELTAPTRPRQ